MKIGFIGLGNMGAPMAANLAKAGHQVLGYDLAEIQIEGLTVASSIEQALEGIDALITMLPNGEILHGVLDQAMATLPPNTLCIDCSTVDVQRAREMATKLQPLTPWVLDAPVSGGISGATQGRLTFMVGGPLAAYEKTEPLFAALGTKSVHCGEAGAGQAAKICNNMILGINMIGTCEAFVLADKLGLARQKLFDVASQSSGYSWVMNEYCPAVDVGPISPADNQYQPGFAAELMLKDLGLAQIAAQISDADTPMGKAAEQLYRDFVEHGDGRGRDFSAMLPWLEGKRRQR